MSKRLTRSGNSLALVIDRPLLEALETDADTDLALSTDCDVLLVTPVRNRNRKKRTAGGRGTRTVRRRVPPTR